MALSLTIIQPIYSEWMQGKKTVAELAREHGVNEKTLSDRFTRLLNKKPKQSTETLSHY